MTDPIFQYLSKPYRINGPDPSPDSPDSLDSLAPLDAQSDSIDLTSKNKQIENQKEKQRKIIHCDCDCFYAAVEMRDNPQLQGIPIAVGGSSDRRGVISTCNYEARAFGVRSAMATAHAKKLCPQLKVLPGRMAVYKDVSEQIHEIFKRYTDLIEPLSLDEAYLDVTDATACEGVATQIAKEIREAVRAEVGITISAGVAPNKFIAKVASDWNKPDGLTVVTPDRVDEFVAQLPVEKIMGVGKVTAKKMHDLNLKTCMDIREQSKEYLIERFGSFGPRLYDIARGIDNRSVKTEWRRKTLSVERTFSQDLASLEACLEAMDEVYLSFLKRCQRLGDDYQPKGILVKIKFDNFERTTIEQHDLSISLDNFKRLLEQGWQRQKRPVRLLGLGIRLKDRNGVQMNHDNPVQLDFSF